VVLWNLFKGTQWSITFYRLNYVYVLNPRKEKLVKLQTIWDFGSLIFLQCPQSGTSIAILIRSRVCWFDAISKLSELFQARCDNLKRRFSHRSFELRLVIRKDWQKWMRGILHLLFLVISLLCGSKGFLECLTLSLKQSMNVYIPSVWNSTRLVFKTAKCKNYSVIFDFRID